MKLSSVSSDSLDLSAFRGDLTGSGEADNSYDAADVTEENADALSDALAASAAANADYTPWTAAAAANSGLPYYAAFSGGTGTAADPYRITTMDQLIFLASEAAAGRSQADSSFLLENDITHNEGLFDAQGVWWDGNGDLQEGILVEWTPIAGFDGIFDGGGHTISGVYSPSGPLLTADPDTLNAWVRENGPGYCRWYAIPGSTAASFLPTALPIQFRLEGGMAADASAVFHYGEPLLTPHRLRLYRLVGISG